MIEARAGAFGKTPDARDFLALGTRSATTVAFEHWLQAENDSFAQQAMAWPTTPICFVFTHDGSHSLLGALAPSRDRVGRTFPLSVFLAVDALPIGLASGAALVSGFLGQCIDFVSQPQTRASLDNALHRIPQLESAHVEATRHNVQSELETLASTEILQQIFGPPEQGAQQCGMHMLQTACLRAQQTLGPSTVLELGAGDSGQRAFCLELVEALRGTTGSTRIPINYFWHETSSPLLVSLGSAPHGVLKFIDSSSPQRVSARPDWLWPTRLRSQPAYRAALRGLLPHVAEVLARPPQSAATLLTALSAPRERR